VATFSSLAGVTLVLLPATVILLFAAMQSLRHGNGVSKWVIVNGFLSMASIALSFYALFGFMPDDPHIITNQEAAIGMGILIIGFVIFTGTALMSSHLTSATSEYLFCKGLLVRSA
jgi:4-amino-4-deoxy-L-arabinose transferase-like glycosyltransferase